MNFKYFKVPDVVIYINCHNAQMYLFNLIVCNDLVLNLKSHLMAANKTKKLFSRIKILLRFDAESSDGLSPIFTVGKRFSYI